MTLSELGQRLETALGPYLGTYEHKSTSYPALSAGTNLPPGFVVKGLECVVRKSPRSYRVAKEFGAEFSSYEAAWEVVLKQWNRDGNLIEPIRAVIEAFPTISNPSVFGPTKEFIEQATFQIPYQEVING